jgi:phosphoenolpyruvate carboxykinase (ATP)
MIPPHKILQTAMKISDIVHYQSSVEELKNDCHQYIQRDQEALLSVDHETGEICNAPSPIHYLASDHISEHHTPIDNFIRLENPAFENIFNQITVYLDGLKDLWVTDCFTLTENNQRFSLRGTSDKPWTNLYFEQRFHRPTEVELEDFHPEWQILCANGLSLEAEPELFSDDPCIVISFQNRLLLITGVMNSVEIMNAVTLITRWLEKKI